MDNQELFRLAKEASKKAYSPYSNIKVGAALLCKNGKIFTGVNVENSSYGGTICAERTAFVKAISEGEREFAKRRGMHYCMLQICQWRNLSCYIWICF
jgi:cytidine deaminase